MFQELSSVIIANAVLLNFASFFTGLLLGHRFNIFLDDRKELNKARAPIRTWLIKQLGDTEEEFPMPDLAEMDYLQQYLPWYHRARFGRDWAAQREQLKNCYTYTPWGAAEFKNSPERIATLQRILKYTR